jgi:hypothetical protein
MRALGVAGLLVAVLAIEPALVRFDVTDQPDDLGEDPTMPLVSGGHDPR